MEYHSQSSWAMLNVPVRSNLESGEYLQSKQDDEDDESRYKSSAKLNKQQCDDSQADEGGLEEVATIQNSLKHETSKIGGE